MSWESKDDEDRLNYRDITCPASELLTAQETKRMATEDTSLYMNSIKNIRADDAVHFESQFASKPSLILDVDNTMFIAKDVRDVLRVFDGIMFYDMLCSIIKIAYSLTLRQRNGDEVVVEQICVDNERIPVKGNCTEFEITSDNGVKVTETCLITSVVVSKLMVVSKFRIEILEINDVNVWHLWLLRAEDPTDLMFGCYRIKFRPDLVEFLRWCQGRFKVVLFTAAHRLVYTELLREAHKKLTAAIGQTDVRLWDENVLFRDDCGPEFTKPIFEKGFAPSRTVLVDNNFKSWRGLEPNSVAINDYEGDVRDNELMATLKPILERVLQSTHSDVRYALNGVRPVLSSEDTKVSNELSLARDYLRSWRCALRRPLLMSPTPTNTPHKSFTPPLVKAKSSLRRTSAAAKRKALTPTSAMSIPSIAAALELAGRCFMAAKRRSSAQKF